MSSLPSALLLTATHCPHCHAMQRLLEQRLEQGKLVSLDVINIEQQPALAEKNNVRSVPWLQLGKFEFSGALEPAELDEWIKRSASPDGMSAYLEYLLANGKLSTAIEWVEQGKADLAQLVPLLSDPAVKMNVRIGIGAVMEHYAGTVQIRDIFPLLSELVRHGHETVRTDACHYLGLTGLPEAVSVVQALLQDDSVQVREVAADSLEELSQV